MGIYFLGFFAAFFITVFIKLCLWKRHINTTNQTPKDPDLAVGVLGLCVGTTYSSRGWKGIKNPHFILELPPELRHLQHPMTCSDASWAFSQGRELYLQRKGRDRLE